MLREMKVGGAMKTNVELLAGVVEHPDWAAGGIDTMWLEKNVGAVTDLGKGVLTHKRGAKGLRKSHAQNQEKGDTVSSVSSGNVLLQPGTLFHLTLSPSGTAPSIADSTKHTLTLSSIARNTFPAHLSGTLQTTLSPTPLTFSLAQSASAAVSSSSFELADPNNPTHVASPLTGKVVELHAALLVGEGDKGRQRWVRKGETLVVLSVMKMENVVVAPWSGMVERVGKGVKVGVVLGEGMLVGVVGHEAEMASRL